VALLHLLEAGIEIAAAAVDSCDASRGVVLETYLAWVLMRRFAAAAPHEAGRGAETAGPRARRREDAAALAQHMLARVTELGIGAA
jgi:hypothetical protein